MTIKIIDNINEKLVVSRLQYITTIGIQKDNLDNSDINNGKSFAIEEKSTNTLKYAKTSNIKYDLIGKIDEGTILIRKTVVQILKGISEEKLKMFKLNPEEFISKIIKLIKEQKATAIVEHISYNKIDGTYESNIFTNVKNLQKI